MSDAQDNVVELPVVEDSLGGLAAPVAAPVERLSEVDRMALELAKANRKVALAQAEKALAQNETAELGYKYVVLQLYMKYGLTELDAINENGLVVRGGAVQQGQ
jgi:hypothetical protein